MWASFPASEVCYPPALSRRQLRLTRPPHETTPRNHPTKSLARFRRDPGSLARFPWAPGSLARFRGDPDGGAISWGPGSSRNGAAIRLLLRGPSAWIRAIQAENLASGTTSGMMFAARSEHAETACRVALVRRASASHRPRGLRCQALVLVVPEGALLSKTTRPSVRTPARKSTQPASRAWRRCAERCSGRWRLAAARIVTPRTVKSSIHSR
jgi:hypothetical protein